MARTIPLLRFPPHPTLFSLARIHFGCGFPLAPPPLVPSDRLLLLGIYSIRSPLAHYFGGAFVWRPRGCVMLCGDVTRLPHRLRERYPCHPDPWFLLTTRRLSSVVRGDPQNCTERRLLLPDG